MSRRCQLLVALSALAVCAALPGDKLFKSKLVDPVDDGASAAATLKSALSIEEWTVAVRRELHQMPELLYELKRTSAYVRAKLDELGIKYAYPLAEEGIVATIGSGEPPCVGLRADMDALPIHEADAKCPFRSRADGKMHACGHDAHTAMLLAAGRLLKQREATLGGTVRLIFQPAEEGGAGGLSMIHDGLLEMVPKMDRVYALHVWPTLPAGVIASRAGTIMAAAGFWHAQFTGRGGHAAMPDQSIDPFSCVGSAQMGLQTVVSRNLSPFEPGVISTTFINGGTAYNVIPSSVEMGGTIRSNTKAGYRYLEERLGAVLGGAAAMGGCELNLTLSSFDDDCKDHRKPPGAPGSCTFPATVNSAAAWEVAARAARPLVGLAGGAVDVHTAEPTMGGEDFAYILEHVPGAMIFLGLGNASLGTDVYLHNPHFRVDEKQMHLGASLLVETALRSLATPAPRRGCAETVDDDDDGLSPAARAQCAEGTQMGEGEE